MNNPTGRLLRNAVVALVPVALALLVSMVVIWMAGAPPVAAMRALLDGAVGGPVQLARTVSFLLPLTLVALGWIVAFTTRRVNIGFEGQIIAGGVAATIVGLYAAWFPKPLHLLIASLVSVAAGGAYAGVAAWLWARRGVNEIIATLLLNLVALEVVGWLVRGPLQQPGVAFPRSPELPPSAQWPDVVPNTPLTWSILVVPLLVYSTWFVLRRSAFGFTLRVTGANPQLARWSGLRTTRANVVALLLSGGIGGLAGGSLILGAETARLSDGFSAGFGFDGIVVALVAQNSTWGVLPAATLFAMLRSGSGLMETRVGVPLELVLITQGLVILLVSGTAFLLQRVRERRVDWESPSSLARGTAEVTGI